MGEIQDFHNSPDEGAWRYVNNELCPQHFLLPVYRQVIPGPSVSWLLEIPFCSMTISTHTWALGPAPPLGHGNKTQVLTTAWPYHSFTWQVHPVPAQAVCCNRFLLKANEYTRRTAPSHILWMLHVPRCTLLSSLQKPEIKHFYLLSAEATALV